MDTGDSPNAGNPKRGDRRGATSRRPAAGNPKRRDRRGTRAAASGRPGVDDGVDPNRAAGLRRRELMLEIRRECQYLSEEIIRGGDGHYHLEMLRELGHRLRSSEMLLQASSSAAPPSDHPGADRTGSGTRVRQSVLYSNRPRRSRPRRPSQRLEHPSEVSSRELELEVANVSTFEAPSVRETSIVSPSEIEEHPSEVHSSELGKAITDLSTLEALSLSDPPLLTPQTAEESESDDDAYKYDDHFLHEPIEFGIGSFGPQTLCYSDPPPRFKWADGVRKRGQTPIEELDAAELGPSRSEVLSRSDSSFPPKSTEKNTTKDSDDDMEEELRLIREYRAAHTYTSLKEGFAAIRAAQHARRTELAAKRGTEPPPPLLAKHLPPVYQETQSLQARQESSPAAAQPQHSTTTRKPRCEASNAELAENAEKWMREEVKMVFEKYIERRDDLKGLDCCFSELSHQCFNVEHYNKIFHHYNFTVRMKEPSSVDWVDALYFAEVKQIFGRKYYFCCRLEPNESGSCYACKSQGVEDLQHPATGGFDSGSPNVGFGLWYE
ncbi:hypothetical protein QOZ80_9AG0691420 [Eleusine coracana subsp. coracana]|nr:hypothetical protein QOZ80_9AG0691420 [Eleusine coracana subsp. coracana]